MTALFSIKISERFYMKQMAITSVILMLALTVRGDTSFQRTLREFKETQEHKQRADELQKQGRFRDLLELETDHSARQRVRQNGKGARGAVGISQDEADEDDGGTTEPTADS